MTGRDRIVLMVIGVIAVLAGSWFLVVSPKRAEVKTAQTQVDEAQKRLDAARATVAQAQQAKRDYDSDYAAVARLGKAVPVDDNVPSLVYQLQSISGASKVSFRSLELTGSATPAAATPPPAATPPASGSSDSSSSSSSSTSTTSTTSSTGTPASPAPATQAAASALPPGASVGAAGFPTMPFSFQFDGTYFDLEKLLKGIDRFITVQKQAVGVHGRLLSVDGFSLTTIPQGIEPITAKVTATAYLLPADQGLTPNATPGGPTTPTTPGASTASTGGTPTPPTAAATGVK